MLKINATTITTIKKGKSLKLTTNSTDEVVWNSSNPKIASIDEDGTITAKATGMVVIRASNGAESSAITVRVTV